VGELSVELEQFIGAGDKVVVFVREKGHSKTGIQMDERHAEVYTVKSRKIVRRQGFSNRNDALELWGSGKAMSRGWRAKRQRSVASMLPSLAVRGAVCGCHSGMTRPTLRPLRRFRPLGLLVVGVTVSALVAAACGGGGKPSLTDKEQEKLANAYSTVTQYCTAHIQQDALRQESGRSLGQLAAAVDTAVDAYRDHEPDAEVQFTPAAPRQMLRDYMRSLETVLGKGDCAPPQAQKVDEALAGDPWLLPSARPVARILGARRPDRQDGGGAARARMEPRHGAVLLAARR